MGVETQVRRLLDRVDDLPDWAYMKAVELSRAMDEGQLSAESLATTMILLSLALERRIKLLEGFQVEQVIWNDWFDYNIDYMGQLLPHDPGVWDDEEEEEEE